MVWWFQVIIIFWLLSLAVLKLAADQQYYNFCLTLYSFQFPCFLLRLTHLSPRIAFVRNGWETFLYILWPWTMCHSCNADSMWSIFVFYSKMKKISFDRELENISYEIAIAWYFVTCIDRYLCVKFVFELLFGVVNKLLFIALLYMARHGYIG